MQAIILAGGKGARLRPYTVLFPKPLVPVGDYPIMEIIIKQLKKAGFENVLVSTGHLSQLIEAYFGNGKRWGIRINYLRETQPLGTAGFLQLINKCENNFMVINGDILTTLDFGKLFSVHVKKGAMATIAVKARESMIDFGVIRVDKENYLREYSEKPVYDFMVSMGIYILSKSCKKLVKKGEAIGMPDLLLRIIESGNKVFCHKTNCFWLDIGRVDDYEKAQEQFNIHKKVLLNGK